jgi:hypothetical protein
MPAKTKDEEKLEAKASLPVNHPKAGYVSPDLSEIVDREPPNEEERSRQSRKRPTREENIEKREKEVKAVAESEDEIAKEESEAEAKAAELAAEAAKKQKDIQAKAGIIPEPTPTSGELLAKQESSSR